VIRQPNLHASAQFCYNIRGATEYAVERDADHDVSNDRVKLRKEMPGKGIWVVTPRIKIDDFRGKICKLVNDSGMRAAGQRKSCRAIAKPQKII
jgi:hypothetical protein